MTKKTAIYVPVGEFRVTSDDMVELWTVTASCVALILTDTVHHVIGMLHVVLPGRRVNLREDDRHAYFADTGAPLLISEMQKAGADKHCMSAVLVGGGSLFQWKEGVDIGRENVEALKTYLKTHNIPVIREETGGAEGRRVSLRTGVHSLLIERIKYSQSDDRVRTDKKVPEGLGLYIDELEKIPSDTSRTELMLSEIHSQEIHQKKVCQILSLDPMLSLYFFRLIHSPYYGVSEAITSYTNARELLSAPHFRRICIVTSFAGNKEGTPALSDIIIRDWRHHSLSTAFIAGHLSEKILPGLKEEAYLAGLLHSLGDLCLALKNPDRTTSGFNYAHNEDLMAGMSLSADLMRFWNFPVLLSEAFKVDLTEGINPTDKVEVLSAILHVSCWVSRLIGITTHIEPENFVLNKQVAKTLGLSDSIHTLLPPIMNGLENLGLKEWIKK